jgi:hypothetical protein
MSPTLTEVYVALRDSIRGGAIDLAAVATGPVTDLHRALEVLRVEDGYPLRNAGVELFADAVELNGDGTFGLTGAAPANVVAVRATLRYTLVDREVGRFSLALEIRSTPWTFGVTFPTLPQAQEAVGLRVRLLPSYLSTLPLASPFLTATATEGEPAGLQLTGSLSASGVLARYAAFFAPWPIDLAGSVVLPAHATGIPQLDLVASSGRPRIEAGPIALADFRLQLISSTDLDPADGLAGLSALNALATLELGAEAPIRGTATLPLLAAAEVWRFLVELEDGPTLADGFAGLARAVGLTGTADFALPPGVRALTEFRFSELDVGVPALQPGVLPRPEHVAVTLLSDQTWVLPVPFLSVTGLGMTWVAGWDEGIAPEYLTASFFGRMVVTAPSPGFALELVATYPSFAVSATLVEGNIPLAAILAHFLGLPPPVDGLTVSSLAIEADLTARTLDASGGLTTGLTLPLAGTVSLALTGVTVWVSADQSLVTGGLAASVVLNGAEPVGAPPPIFVLNAEHDGEGWIFSGRLTPDSVVDLTALVARFSGGTAPAHFDLLLQELAFRYALASGGYGLAGAIATRWTPQFLGLPPVAVSAEASLSRADRDANVSARLAGGLRIGGFAVVVAVNLTASELTYAFEILFGELWVSAQIDWRGQGTGRHQVLSIQVGGVTLGELIEQLVQLVAPTLTVRLEPPWDLLNRIDLSRFLLVIDPTEKMVEVTYQAEIDLPMLRVTGIGLRASRANGRPSVMLLLQRAGQEPLGWDLLSGQPPALAGEGKDLIRLRYLGIGQRVRLKGAAPTTLRNAIARLRADLQPPDELDRNPLRQGSGAAVEFSPGGGWLVGLDLTLADAVDLALVFQDPGLYGLAVTARGEKIGALAGLQFDILYRKVSADAGVFRVELELPESLRRLEFGPVSITLGLLVVDVYTNGGFRVDVGFPHGGDFSRSFTVQVLPVIGRGGFYVGRLVGGTSERVPRITNGTFSPVLELGVGFAAGVGKEFRAGPLSGGAYLELVAVFEGVFGWFNPTDTSARPEQYHWAHAMVGLHGKIYGQIDLWVLKLAVTIEAWAEVSAVFEAYRATELRFAARIEVSAELTIGFIRLPLSFGDDVEFAFTLGTDGPAPWQLSDGQGSTDLRRRRRNILPPLGRVPRRRLEQLRHGATEVPLWRPTRRVFDDSPRTARLTMLPLMSVTDVPLVWSGNAPDNPAPKYRTAIALFAPSSDQDAAEPPARLFVEALLRWSIAAATDGSDGTPATAVSAAQLLAAAEALDAMPATGGPFRGTDLATFFRTNLHLSIAGDPSGNPSSFDAALVPLPPVLRIASPQAGVDHDLARYHRIGPYYGWGVARYAASLTPAPNPVGAPPADDPAQYQSYSGVLFEDWCLMVAKASVRAAAAGLAGWPVPLTGPTSLSTVANMFPTAQVSYLVRAGDTVDSVAAAVGAGPAELLFLNPRLPQELAGSTPGAKLSLAIGVAPETVAVDNAAVPIEAPGGLRLGNIDYQVAAGDTLAAVAGWFRRIPAQLFPGGLADPLARDIHLLRADAPFPMPAVRYLDAPGRGRLMSAAMFFAHYFPLAQVESTSWYTAALFDLNRDEITWQVGDPVPAGFVLRIPAAYNDADPGRAGRYPAAPGDTLATVARLLALTQLFGTGPGGPVQWPAFRDAVTLVGAEVQLPAAEVKVLPRESLAAMAARLIVTAGDLGALLGIVAGEAILADLAVVPVVDVVVLAQGQSLQALAERVGLTIEDLAARVQDQELFGPGTTLTVAHLPVQAIDKLVTMVLTGPATGTICAQASRNLFVGSRLLAPDPDEDGRVAATGPLTALYDLTGQQFATPAPDRSRPTQTALEITVTADADWVTMASSQVATAEDTVDGLRARVPDVDRHNPELAARLRPGLIVRGGEVGSLTFRYTNDGLEQAYPATALGVAPVAGQGPAALPRGRWVPVTYGLDHRIELQTPVPLRLPELPSTVDADDVPAPPGAHAWRLPAALRAYADAHPDTPFDVVRVSRRPDASGEPEVLRQATFASLLRFRVRRVPAHPRVYQLIGADQVDRESLLWLWIRLTVGPPAQIVLGAAPAPDADHPSGIAMLDTAADQTFIVRTNQSVVTAPPGTAGAPLAANLDVADLTTPAQFLRLLWEGTVVGGTGFHLGIATRAGGELPPGCFDECGVAELFLLSLTVDEQALSPGGRRLYPHETCVVLAAGLDPTTTALWVEAADDRELRLEAVVPQGSAGFGLTLTKPPATGVDPTLRLHRLFSLVRFAIAADDPNFRLADAGLPVLPLADDGLRRPAWQRARLDRRRRAGRAVADAPPSDLWRYEQVLPLSRYGPDSPAPTVPGLPAPVDDPYRGVGTAARLHLGLSDVLGNISTLPGGSTGTVALPVGCTDPVLGPSQWPGVTAMYWIDRDAAGVSARVTLAIQPAATMPAPDGDATATRATVTQAAELFGRAYFQLIGGRATAAVVTSLRPAVTGSPDPLPVALTPLWRLAAAAYLATRAAAAAEPVFAGGSLDAISLHYGVSYAAIAAANAGAAATTLVGAAPVVPAYHVVADGESAAGVVAALPPGWPRPGSGTDLLRANLSAPLRAGAVLATAVVNVPATAATLAAVARDRHTTPGLLAADSADRTGILVVGFVFEYEGTAVPVVSASTTWTDVAVRFAELGVAATVADLAEANAQRPGLLVAGATLTSRHYVARDGDTLADNRSTVADLTADNATTVDLFPAGTLLWVGVFTGPHVTPDAGEPLVVFAARFACPPALLLAANAPRSLDGTPVQVPGAVQLPAAGALRVPYAIRDNDTLAGVAALFGAVEPATAAFLDPAPLASGALDLAFANAAMPGTLAAGQTVVVIRDQVPYETLTIEGDSLASVHMRLMSASPGITFAEVVAAVASTSGYLASGALLSCPAALALSTPDGMARAYGVDAGAWAAANAGVLGLIRPGVPMRGAAEPVLTAPEDTFNSLVARFAAAGSTMDIADLVAANADNPFLVDGAACLLPVAPAVFRVGLGEPGPFATPTVPLTVALRLQRPDHLIDPDLRTPQRNGAAERADSPVAAQMTLEGAGTGRSRTLAAFAAAFHTAVPLLRLATAPGAAGAGSDRTDSADLWLVDFGPSGIARVAVEPGAALPDGTPVPRYFALRPLYRAPQTRAAVPLPTVDDEGRLVEGAPADVQSADVEVWARLFLSDLDSMLSAPYACGIYADPAARPVVKRLLEVKAGLALSIARGTAEILNLPIPASPDELAAAARTLQDRMAVELLPGYDTAAVVQYRADVRSPWTGGIGRPARLLGSATPTTAGGVPYQLAAAKTELNRTTSPVSFVLTVPDPQRQRSVSIAAHYDLTHLEYDIRTIPGTGGYQASDWLTFYPPLRGDHVPPEVYTDLGQASVPIPLRACPPQPALQEQSAEPTVAEPDLATAGRWTYAVAYAHEHAAQDEVIATVVLNQSPQAAPTAPAETDMVVALARYAAVADQLRSLLAAYPDATPASPDATPASPDAMVASLGSVAAANAVGSFAQLAEAVAEQWAEHRWPVAADAESMSLNRFVYGLSTTDVGPDGDRYLSTVDVRLGLDDPSPGPGGQWPQVQCRAGDGHLVTLIPGQPGAGGRTYTVPGDASVPRTAWLALTLRWPDLPVTEFQNARASLHVRRNHRLLDSGPDTREGFVFRTAEVTASTVVSPVLVRPAPIDITAGDLTTALRTALAALTGDTPNIDATIIAWYGYEIVPGLATRLPAVLLPRQRVDSTTADRVARRLQDWLLANSSPATAGRRWQLAVAVHSNLAGVDEQPLLIVDQLIHRIASR